MNYLIDGHNLIGQIAGLNLDDPNDEAKLVEHLKRFAARRRARCTVVFDGGLPGGLSRDLSTYSVRVVFAHGGTTADAIIIERLRKVCDPGSVVVVTADHEIIDAATRRRIRVIPPRQFAQEMNAPARSDEDTSNPHLTPGEIAEWLALFGGDADDS